MHHSAHAKESARNSGPIRRLVMLLLRGILALLLGLLFVIVMFRWLPVPYSSLMLQRWFAAQVDGESDFALRQRWRPLSAISPHAALAVVASEDQKFPFHYGFDLEAIDKAMEDNPHRKRPRGASTISQQVAKNLFLWPGRSFVRKGIEAGITVLLEGLWPKARILEVYLNVAEFGSGIFGVEAASQAFFHKSAAKLNQAEAAILAAILPSPLRSSAMRPSAYISERAWHIQRQMRQLGGIGYLGEILPGKHKD
ncbi:MAG: monofunctional biosynthetic peptidoglycan transglycosylase [Thermodesulfobacteriota bacterium]